MSPSLWIFARRRIFAGQRLFQDTVGSSKAQEFSKNLLVQQGVKPLLVRAGRRDFPELVRSVCDDDREEDNSRDVIAG